MFICLHVHVLVLIHEVGHLFYFRWIISAIVLSDRLANVLLLSQGMQGECSANGQLLFAEHVLVREHSVNGPLIYFKHVVIIF